MKPYKFYLLLVLNSVLAGCGQPGPLYLPDEAPPAQTEPETETKTEKTQTR